MARDLRNGRHIVAGPIAASVPFPVGHPDRYRPRPFVTYLSSIPVKAQTTTTPFVSRHPASRARRRPVRRAQAREADAIAFLVAEHQVITDLYARVANGRHETAARTHELVTDLCNTLRIHMMLEEEIFYPAVRRAMGFVGGRADDSREQHAAAKPLLAQLAAMRPGDPHYDAMLRQLGEYVRLHHRQEEDLFPMARASGLNMRALGAEMRARKRTLLSATIVLGEVLTTAL